MATAERQLQENFIPSLAAGINFELSPIQEEWMAGAQPTCLSCITVLCICCSSPKIGPPCDGGPINLVE